MQNANLAFSKNEFALVANSDFILTKNRVIEKIYFLFGKLSEAYKVILDERSYCLPGEVLNIPPKIYRGEQYKNLPYVMLDYPRYFSKTDVVAIRSFFWWGNYFSITLQVAGKYIKVFADNIFRFTQNKENSDWYFGTGHSAWEHHFEKENYLPFENINDVSIEAFKQKPFIKIAIKLSLEKWECAEDFYLKNYELLVNCLCVSTA